MKSPNFSSTGLVDSQSSFEANAVLPAQFYNARRGTASVERLRRLMFAILADAIRCFQTKSGAHDAAGRRQFAEAKSWILSDEENGVFSFIGVCDALDIDPGSLRKWLLRWQERKLSNEGPRLIPARRRLRSALRSNDSPHPGSDATAI